MKNTYPKRTAYVFVDELQAGQSQVIFGTEYTNGSNFPVIEVAQSNNQERTVRNLLSAVKERYPEAKVKIAGAFTYIIN